MDEARDSNLYREQFHECVGSCPPKLGLFFTSCTLRLGPIRMPARIPVSRLTIADPR